MHHYDMKFALKSLKNGIFIHIKLILSQILASDSMALRGQQGLREHNEGGGMMVEREK